MQSGTAQSGTVATGLPTDRMTAYRLYLPTRAPPAPARTRPAARARARARALAPRRRTRTRTRTRPRWLAGKGGGGGRGAGGACKLRPSKAALTKGCLLLGRCCCCFIALQMLLVLLMMFCFGAPFMFVTLGFGWFTLCPSLLLSLAFFGTNEVALQLEVPKQDCHTLRFAS